MEIKEMIRIQNNEKVKIFADSIMHECEKNELTLSDMNDLAVILKDKIRKAIISNEEQTIFRNFVQKQD